MYHEKQRPKRHYYVKFGTTDELRLVFDWCCANGIQTYGSVSEGDRVLLYSAKRNVVPFKEPFEPCDFEKEVSVSEFRENLVPTTKTNQP